MKKCTRVNDEIIIEKKRVDDVMYILSKKLTAR